MGCFDYACAISGLPIKADDDIRWLLLTENPYEKDSIVSIHDAYFPRTWPLRAKYNHYGSIKDYDTAGLGVYAVVEGLKKDLVEVGTGDNTVHDVPTLRGMGFEAILNAVREGRIVVEREEWRDKPETAPEGCPTLQRIRTLLLENGFVVDDTPGGYLVDEHQLGWVRIRSGGYNRDQEHLRRILPPLQQHYAAMITAGSGSYAFGPEIQIMPLPNDKHVTVERDEENRALKLYQMMIHSRVWDAIVGISPSFKKFRDEVQKEWDDEIEFEAHEIRIKEMSARIPELAELPEMRRMFRRGSCLGYSLIPYTMGPGEHMAYLYKRHTETPFTTQQISDFLNDAAGFICVHRYVQDLQYWWKPSWYAGQCSTYRKHQEWADLLSEICQQIRTARIDRGFWTVDEDAENGD